MQAAGRLRANRSQQAWCADLITGIYGRDLLFLKSLLDSGGNHNNLHKLIFKDITDTKIRARILDHFMHTKTNNVDNVRPARESAQKLLNACMEGELKVLSDIDDTFICSGGHFPAGVDKRFPKGCVYPGVTDLYNELNRPNVATIESNVKARALQVGKNHYKYTCHLVFLSARPHIVKDMSESMSYRFFQLLVNEKRLDAMPTLLAGKLRSSVLATVRAVVHWPNPWGPMGVEKYRCMRDYNRLHPDSPFVFFGDNGQGDVVAAEMAVSDDESERIRQMRAAFISEVQPLESTTTTLGDLTIAERRNWWQARRIFFVRSYVMAAVQAAKIGILSCDGLRRVCEGAGRQLEALIYVYSLQMLDWKKIAKEHNEDIMSALEFLRSRDPREAALPLINVGQVDDELQNDNEPLCEQDYGTRQLLEPGNEVFQSNNLV